MQRRHFNPTQSLNERLSDEAQRLRYKADIHPPGTDREAAMQKARQAGSHVSEWSFNDRIRRVWS